MDGACTCSMTPVSHVSSTFGDDSFLLNQGSVLYMNSPEDPAVCVGKLAHYHKGSDNVLNGQYRVVGDRVGMDVWAKWAAEVHMYYTYAGTYS